MSFIIDLIGAAIIGSMLVLMMMTFQFQMHEAVDRSLYTISMIDVMDQTATKLNNVIALCGVGLSPSTAVKYATQDSLVFETYWNFQTDQIGGSIKRLSIKLSNVPSPYGTAVVIRQNGVPLTDLGYLFWINQLKFRYYTKTDGITTTASLARSTEVRISFFREAPRVGGKPITTKLQFKCYFMNAYMQGA
jgi:hypothetical protein